MADTTIDYTNYVGRVVFPRSPFDLTNTATCPACLTLLTSGVCSVCGLDLNHPAAADLLQASMDVAAALDRRLALIGRIRFETAQLLEEQTAAHTAESAPALAHAPGSRPAVAASDVGPTEPHHSSVQVVMLIVGVSLLSIAALFFLVFAFISYGLLARSLITGSITIVAIVVASILHRRQLRATAEGIAVFAAILIYLDAFAVRANDLAGLGSSDNAAYWGATLLGSAAAFVLWHRASGLRVPNIVGFAAFAPGLGLLVGGLIVGLTTPDRYFAGFMAAALAGLAYPLAATHGSTPKTAQHGRAEATIVSLGGLFALVCCFFTSFAVQPGSVWGAGIALLIVTLVALFHVLVAAGTPAQHAAARTAVTIAAISAASIGALALASTGAAVALRTGSFEAILFWPLIIAAVVVLALEATARVGATPLYSVAAHSAAVSAGVILTLTLLVTVATSLTPLAVATRGYANPWSISLAERPVSPDMPVRVALAALAAAALIAFVFWAAAGTLRHRGRILLWTGCILFVLAVPLLETLWMLTAAWFLIAALGLALLLASARRLPMRASLRLPIACGSAAALLLGYSVSWHSVDIWGWATLASIVLLLGARAAAGTRRRLPRALFLAAATIDGLVGIAALARQWDGNAASWESSLDTLHFVGILATVLIAAAALLPERFTIVAKVELSPLDRRAMFWIAAPTAFIVAAAGMLTLEDSHSGPAPAGMLLPEYWTSLVLAIALLAALVPWSTGSRAATLRPERAFAVVALAPVSYWIVDSFARVADLPTGALSTAPIVAALLVSAGALAVTMSPRLASPRWLSDVSVALVAVPGVLIALPAEPDTAWLTLIIAGVTALILAVSDDGLFASTSPRRQLGWPALVLATAGLWMRLGSDHVTAIEAYVLPVAGALLLVSAAMAYSVRGREVPHRTAPFITLAGLLVAILPLATDAAGGAALRAYVVGTLCALLLLASSYASGRAVLRPYLDTAIIAGALGVLTTTVGRAIGIVVGPGGNSDVTLDLWLGGAFFVLIAAAVGVTRAGGRPEPWRPLVGSTLVVTGMTLVFIFEAVSLDSTGLGFTRAFGTLVLLLTVYLTGALWCRAPFTRVVGRIALGFGAAVALLGIVTGAVDPIEFVTVPVALALLADGVVRLAEIERLRSWTALGPGVAVLLAPSLFATVEERPLWRLVALGVVAVAVLTVGAMRRLQAPFVLGVIVALVHGGATFSAEIRVVYQALPGWLWLGIGGVVLIALAARYEKRIKNLKEVTRMVTALR